MFNQEQYDAWMMTLSEYFIKHYDYHIVAMPKNIKEIWLVNPKRDTQRIVTITSLPINSLDRIALETHRKLLLKVYQIEDEGLTISVNQSMVPTDDYHVVVGPGVVSKSSQIEGFKNIQNILKPSSNASRAVNQAMGSLNRQIQKVQRRGARKLMPVTTVVSTLCVVLFFVMATLMSTQDMLVAPAAVMMGAYYKPLIVAGNEWFRLITAGFLHADVFHLFMNLFALNMIARVAEPVLGKRKYLILLLFGVVSGNLFVFIRNEPIPGLGLSGGIFALMGWLIVYLFESGAFRNKKLRNDIIFTLALNVMISTMPGISFMAHLGGFVFGVFFAVIVSKHKEWELNRQAAMVMSLAMVVSMGFLTYKNMDYELIPQLDRIVIQNVRDFGFDAYADRLTDVLK